MLAGPVEQKILSSRLLRRISSGALNAAFTASRHPAKSGCFVTIFCQ